MCPYQKYRMHLKELLSKYALYDRVTQDLYHYTGENGLKGIIATGELWLTNYEDLRSRKDSKADPLELKILNNYLNKKINPLIEIHRDLKIYFDDHMAKCECYVLSLCEDASNVHLWKEYGPYALRFNKKLFSANPRNITKKVNDARNKGYGCVILKSDYIDEIRFKGPVKKCIDSFIELLPSLHGIRRDKLTMNFIQNIYPQIPRYKSKQYQVEKEHRLYVMNSNFKPISSEHKTNNKFIFDDGVKEHLSEIIIGKEATMNEDEIRQLLKRSNEEARAKESSALQYNVDKIIIRQNFLSKPDFKE